MPEDFLNNTVRTALVWSSVTCLKGRVDALQWTLLATVDLYHNTGYQVCRIVLESHAIVGFRSSAYGDTEV